MKRLDKMKVMRRCIALGPTTTGASAQKSSVYTCATAVILGVALEQGDESCLRSVVLVSLLLERM